MWGKSSWKYPLHILPIGYLAFFGEINNINFRTFFLEFFKKFIKIVITFNNVFISDSYKSTSMFLL